jgi:hypothetical protein
VLAIASFWCYRLHMAKKREAKKDPIAVAMSAKRMTKMTPAQRTAVAKNAAQKRWGTKKKVKASA